MIWRNAKIKVGHRNKIQKKKKVACKIAKENTQQRAFVSSIEKKERLIAIYKFGTLSFNETKKRENSMIKKKLAN